MIRALLLAALVCAPLLLRGAASLPEHVKWRLHADVIAQKGEFQEALATSRKALTAAESSFGVTSHAVITYVLDLAMLQRHNGDYQGALKNYLWARGLVARNGSTDTELITTINVNLGGLYVDTGEWARALPLLEGAAESFPDQARWEAVARNYRRLNRPGRARLACDRGLALESQNADSIGRLLMLKASMLEGEDGLAILNQALDVREKAYKKGHYRIADVFDALAQFHLNAGNKSAADKFLEKSEKIRRGTIGPADWKSRELLGKAACMYAMLDKFEKVIGLREKLLEVQVKAHGTEHAATGAAHMNLAKALWDLDKKSKAEKEWKRGLKILEKALGADHPALQGLKLNTHCEI